MRTCLLAALLAAPAAADPPDLSAAFTAIKAVGREGAGNEAAAAGWKAVVAAGGDALFPTLAAFDGASPAAANWLRAAVDAIAEAEKKAGREIPIDPLSAFVKDAKRSPTARRIAFELYAKIDERAASRMLPRMIDDPSLELRRDAIAARLAVLDLAYGGTPDLKTDEVRRLMNAARDRDQVEQLTKLLAKAGDKVDLPARFGFVTRWHVAGPFDGPAGGFAAKLPPEAGVDLNATYPGKGGTVGWKVVTATQPKDHYALVNLHEAIGKPKDAVAFAYAVVEAKAATPVELRAACPTSLRLFLNGKEVFARDEYHHGNRFDQHAGAGTLKAGRNEILVKVCQNNQKEEWAQAWEFELRVCDPLGGPVPFEVVSPAKEAK